MAIQLINCQTYREQPGRRRVFTWGKFDAMSTVLIGPVAYLDQWIPQVGSSHPDYPGMFVQNCTAIEKSGVLQSIAVNYMGFMMVNGWINGQVQTSSSTTETSASIQLGATQVINLGKSTVVGFFVNGQYTTSTNFSVFSYGKSVSIIPMYGMVGRVERRGWATLSINYMSTSVTHKYCRGYLQSEIAIAPINGTFINPTVQIPPGFSLIGGGGGTVGSLNPSQLSGAIVGDGGSAQFQVLSVIIGDVSGTDLTYGANGEVSGNVPSGGGPDRGSLTPPFPSLIVELQSQQIGTNFFEVSETWSYKYIEASHVT
jgi:hypothetical protein